MIPKIASIRENDFFNVNPTVSDHLLFHDHVKNLVLHVFIVTDNSFLIELRHTYDTLKFKDNLEILDHLIIHPSQIIDLFLDLTLAIDRTSVFIFTHLDLRRDHAQDLRPHLEDFL